MATRRKGVNLGPEEGLEGRRLEVARHPGPHGEQETRTDRPRDRQLMGTYPEKSFEDASV